MDIQRFLGNVFLANARDVVSTVKALAFLGTAVIGSGAALAYLLESHVDKQGAVIFGIAGVSLAAVFGLASRYYFRLAQTSAPYKILRTVGILEISSINGHHRYVNEKRWLIEATREDVRLAESVSHWTGQSKTGSSGNTSLNPDHDLFTASNSEEDGRTHNWVYFGRPLFRGERIEFGIRQIFEDDIRRLRPFYREGSGRFSVRELKATARFLLSDDPAVVKGTVWKDRKVCGELDVERKVDFNAGTVDYIVSVARTRPRHSYGVRWSWPGK